MQVLLSKTNLAKERVKTSPNKRNKSEVHLHESLHNLLSTKMGQKVSNKKPVENRCCRQTNIGWLTYGSMCEACLLFPKSSPLNILQPSMHAYGNISIEELRRRKTSKGHHYLFGCFYLYFLNHTSSPASFFCLFLSKLILCNLKDL